MGIRWSFTAAALAVLVWSTSHGAAAAARKPVTHTVTIDGTAFQPAEITIDSGDSVVWINKDPFPHTATSDTGGFDSKTIAAGGRWRYAAKKRGVFEYVCSLHPTMKGTLRVR